MPELNTNLLASIGQNAPDAGATVAKSYQLKDMMNQEQINELKVKQSKQDMQENAEIKDALQKEDLSTPEGQSKAAASVMKINPMKGMDFMKTLNDMMKSTEDTHKTQLESISARADIEGNAAFGLMTTYQNLIKKGVPDAQARAQMQPLYQQTLQGLVSKKLPDGSKVLGDDQLKSIVAHPTFDPEFVGNIVSQSKQARDSLMQQKTQDREAATLQEKVRHDEITEGQGQQKVDQQQQKLKSELAAGKLSPDTVNDLATQFNLTGKLPAMGRGNNSMVARVQILNTAAQQLKDAGQDEQGALVAQSALKAGQQAYAQVLKSKEMIGNYEKTALKNMELVRQASAKVDRGGSPIINKWILAGRKALKGDPDVTNFDTTITSFVQEYAKVMSGSTGASGSTDAQTQHAYDLLNKAMNNDQVLTVLGTLTKEMDNRVSSYDDQLSQLRSDMGMSLKKPDASGADAPAAADPLGIRK